MRRSLFATAAALLVLGSAPDPVDAETKGWGRAHWSLPAGARFVLERGGRHIGFAGGHRRLIVIRVVDRLRCCDRHGGIVLPRESRWHPPASPDVRRFDPVSRTVPERKRPGPSWR